MGSLYEKNSGPMIGSPLMTRRAPLRARLGGGPVDASGYGAPGASFRALQQSYHDLANLPFDVQTELNKRRRKELFDSMVPQEPAATTTNVLGGAFQTGVQSRAGGGEVDRSGTGGVFMWKDDQGVDQMGRGNFMMSSPGPHGTTRRMLLDVNSQGQVQPGQMLPTRSLGGPVARSATAIDAWNGMMKRGIGPGGTYSDEAGRPLSQAEVAKMSMDRTKQEQDNAIALDKSAVGGVTYAGGSGPVPVDAQGRPNWSGGATKMVTPTPWPKFGGMANNLDPSGEGFLQDKANAASVQPGQERPGVGEKIGIGGAIVPNGRVNMTPRRAGGGGVRRSGRIHGYGGNDLADFAAIHGRGMTSSDYYANQRRGGGDFIINRAATHEIDPVTGLPQNPTEQQIQAQIDMLAKKGEEPGVPGAGGLQQAALISQYYDAKKSRNPLRLREAADAIEGFKRMLNYERSRRMAAVEEPAVEQPEDFRPVGAEPDSYRRIPREVLLSGLGDIDSMESSPSGLPKGLLPAGAAGDDEPETFEPVKKKSGGSVADIHPYIVNEEGPEAFKPDGGDPELMLGGEHMTTFERDGRVIPHRKTLKMLKEGKIHKVRHAEKGSDVKASNRSTSGELWATSSSERKKAASAMQDSALKKRMERLNANMDRIERYAKEGGLEGPPADYDEMRNELQDLASYKNSDDLWSRAKDSALKMEDIIKKRSAEGGLSNRMQSREDSAKRILDSGTPEEKKVASEYLKHLKMLNNVRLPGLGMGVSADSLYDIAKKEAPQAAPGKPAPATTVTPAPKAVVAESHQKPAAPIPDIRGQIRPSRAEEKGGKTFSKKGLNASMVPDAEADAQQAEMMKAVDAAKSRRTGTPEDELVHDEPGDSRRNTLGALWENLQNASETSRPYREALSKRNAADEASIAQARQRIMGNRGVNIVPNEAGASDRTASFATPHGLGSVTYGPRKADNSLTKGMFPSDEPTTIKPLGQEEKPETGPLARKADDSVNAINELIAKIRGGDEAKRIGESADSEIAKINAAQAAAKAGSHGADSVLSDIDAILGRPSVSPSELSGRDLERRVGLPHLGDEGTMTGVPMASAVKKGGPEMMSGRDLENEIGLPHRGDRGTMTGVPMASAARGGLSIPLRARGSMPPEAIDSGYSSTGGSYAPQSGRDLEDVIGIPHVGDRGTMTGVPMAKPVASDPFNQSAPLESEAGSGGRMRRRTQLADEAADEEMSPKITRTGLRYRL